MNEICRSRRVDTIYGPVVGFHGQNPAVTVFKGIPYAAPPVGELRFMPPVSPASWKETLPCYQYAAAPMQSQPVKNTFYQGEFYPVDRTISEDCLYLNVWTPATTDEERCPVMVWFHGGGFGGGSADEITFDGEAMAKRGIILVTVGYRVNVFSAFVHLSAGLRGNCGSKDQIFALQWVQKNIEAFGGDKNNVTIFGQSAGAVAVEALLGSPLTKGLFHKAIVQSCGGTQTLSGRRTIEMADRDFSTMLEESHLSVETVKTMEAGELFSIYNSFQKRHYGCNCYPMIDGELLLESPGNLVRSGKVPDLPYIVGTTDGDNFFRTVPLTASYEKQLNEIRQFFGGAEAEEFIAKYLPNEESLPEFQRQISELSQLGASESFAISLSGRTSPVYAYRFNRFCPGQDCRNEKEGMGYHSFELWYVFGTIAHCWRPLTGVDYDLSCAMLDYWCSFAKTGDPNLMGEHPIWPAFTRESPLTLEINEREIAPHEEIRSSMNRELLAEMLRRGE